MGLRYAVITSVDRDDLPDGGSKIFAQCISEIRKSSPNCQVEVLIPDFRGKAEPLEHILNQRPDVLNHNMESVPRALPSSETPGTLCMVFGSFKKILPIWA